MIKKTVTYIDFDGVERTEDCYFNLTAAEIAELEYSVGGGFKAMLEKIIKEDDHKRIIEYFKQIVLLAYGEREGRQFYKSEKIRSGFAASEAYSVIFMELANDAKAASEFINGIIPAAAATQAGKPQENK